LNLINAREINSLLPENLNALEICNIKNPGKNSICIQAVGDVGFSGRIRELYQSKGNYDYIFSDVSCYIKTGDVVFGNLESPLVKVEQENSMFAGDPAGAKFLKMAGFNNINLANNHILDYGVEGLISTIKNLLENDVTPLGVGQNTKEADELIIFEKNGCKIGFLATARTLMDQTDNSTVFSELRNDKLLDNVEKNKSLVDFLVVSIHAGLMYLDYPKPEFKEFVEELMNKGANLILVHHAHVLQSVQVTSDGNMCCYNLGNFLWDWKEGYVEIPIMVKEQRESAIFTFEIENGKIIQAFAIPIFLDDDFLIRWAEGIRGDGILTRLVRLSNDIEKDYTSLYEKQRAERNASPIIKVVYQHFILGDWKYVLKMLRSVRWEHIKMLFRFFVNKIFGVN
jgi:poly-gamma-glutamate synthesis protein (capsule biosynthesis protein)